MLYRENLTNISFDYSKFLEMGDDAKLNHYIECGKLGLVDFVHIGNLSIPNSFNRFLTIKINESFEYVLFDESISVKLKELEMLSRKAFDYKILSIKSRNYGNYSAVYIIEINDSYISLLLDKNGFVFFYEKGSENYELILTAYNLSLL